MTMSQQPYLDIASAVRSGEPGPPNQHERAIATLLREHGPREGEALAEYQKLVAECTDEGVKYLASLILEDERRHHQVINEMLHQIESFLWDSEQEPRTPYLSERVDPELRAATDRLLEFEREDAKELRRLRREVKSQPSSSLLPLLVDLMIHDTAKHIEILKLIRKHTKAR